MGHRDISYPLASFLLDPQEALDPHQFDTRTGNVNLLCFPIQEHRQGEDALFEVPVLMLPLEEAVPDDHEQARPALSAVAWDTR